MFSTGPRFTTQIATPQRSERDEDTATSEYKYRLNSTHTGGIAMLINYINMARQVSDKHHNRIYVNKKNGKREDTTLHDISISDRMLIESGWAKLKTKLNPYSSKIGRIAAGISLFIEQLIENLPQEEIPNVMASLGNYIAIHARLLHRIQSTVVIEPQWNFALLKKEMNDTVRQLNFYLYQSSYGDMSEY
tara:strand:- start:833 stop:1405 length:573 start_codon:yes stop_codon:yes gene_type:complete